MKNASTQAKLQTLSEQIHSDTVLPLAEAQVNVRNIAIQGITHAVEMHDNGGQANLIVEWWAQAHHRIGRAIANAEAVKTSLREVIAGE